IAEVSGKAPFACPVAGASSARATTDPPMNRARVIARREHTSFLAAAGVCSRSLMTRLASVTAAAFLLLGACEKREPEVQADRAALLDPQNCKSCHPVHVDEWAGSMHAYASDDPLFRAMNKRGQRETNGALGDFCVKCHAPLAVRDGLTRDGLNLDQVPATH